MSQRQDNRARHDHASVTGQASIMGQVGGSGVVLAVVAARQTESGWLIVAR